VLRSSSACVATNDQPEPSSVRGQRWSRPAPNKYKCNIYVAISSSLNKVGICMRVRDGGGCFVLVKTV
jgi:hypothetical protein